MKSKEKTEFKEAFCLMWYACVGRIGFEDGLRPQGASME